MDDRTLAQRWMEDHWPAMTAAARGYTPNAHEAEDIAQEAFWAAWLRRDSLKEPAKIRSWLLSFVRYKALHALRARQRRGDSVELEQVDEGALQRWLAASSSGGGRRAKVLAALNALPETQSKLVRLVLEGRTDDEIADRMGIKKSTIYVYKHRAIKQLREIVKGGGGKSIVTHVPTSCVAARSSRAA